MWVISGTFPGMRFERGHARDARAVVRSLMLGLCTNLMTTSIQENPY